MPAPGAELMNELQNVTKTLISSDTKRTAGCKMHMIECITANLVWISIIIYAKTTEGNKVLVTNPSIVTWVIPHSFFYQVYMNGYLWEVPCNALCLKMYLNG